jgi:ParB-like chromosome segregation protein Spo0J
MKQPLTVESWPIERPIPYARNARKMSARALDVISASLKEFGFRQPIVVDGADVVIVGHTRLAAAKKLGFTEVPVHVASNLTPGQVAAYRIMDNRSSQETSWDFELLAPELLDLKGLDIDLTLTGFSVDELTKLIDPAPPAADPEGADETAQLVERFQVLVSCKDEPEQGRLLEQLNAEGYECRALIS